MQSMEADSTAVLGNVRALRELLRDCQARVKELEAGSIGIRKCVSFKEPETQEIEESDSEKKESAGISLHELHPGLKAQLRTSQASKSSPSSSASSRPSLLRADEDSESNYVGSYGKLVSFLRASNTEGAITESEAAELLAAVEDISRLGSGQQVRQSQPLFRNASKQDFATLLPSMGIEVPTAANGMGRGERRSLIVPGDRSQKFFVSQEAIEASKLILANPGFNCRARGDIHSDTEVVVHGFSAPLDLLELHNIDCKVLRNWVIAIAEQYRANSYHNWMHALDVFQFCHLALAPGEAGEYFEDQDILALLTAAIAHDTSHPGYNNAFIINTSHDVAITYNDKSPLENMHASLCFQTLRKDGLNFLSDMPVADYKVLRSKVIDAILATDMSHHFELVDRFSARVSATDINPFFKGPINDAEKQNAGKEDRRMLLQAFTHMADLGHCCRPWDVHRHMVVALENEFFLQGDKERELGLPVMPLMDRHKDSAAASQGFFLSKMVTPLLESFCVVLKDDLGQTLQTNTSVNGHRWAGLINLHGRMTAAQLIEKELAEETDGAQNSALSPADVPTTELLNNVPETTREDHSTDPQSTLAAKPNTDSDTQQTHSPSKKSREADEHTVASGTSGKAKGRLARSFPKSGTEQKKNDGTASPRTGKATARTAAAFPDRQADQKTVSQGGGMRRLLGAGLG